MAKVNLENVGGRQTVFGPVTSDNTRGGKVATLGHTKEVTYTFEFGDLPLDSDPGNEMLIPIPAGSLIVGAELKITEAWVNGTNVTVGLDTKAGVPIDADGLIDATDGATANLTLQNVVVGTGALIGATSGQDPAVVVVAATGAYTAGKAELLVQYRAAEADAA